MYELVVIGGSAGSLDVMIKTIPFLDPDLPVALVLVMHRKASNDSRMVDLLASKTTLTVKEAEEKELITTGTIYIAPPDYHLLIEKTRSFSLDASEKINYSRPSIDVTFESAADVYGSAVICILLSGANADGVEGLKSAKAKNAFIVVQDPLSAEVPFMPQQAVNQVPVDAVLHKDQIKDFINQLKRG